MRRPASQRHFHHPSSQPPPPGPRLQLQHPTQALALQHHAGDFVHGGGVCGGGGWCGGGGCGVLVVGDVLVVIGCDGGWCGGGGGWMW